MIEIQTGSLIGLLGLLLTILGGVFWQVMLLRDTRTKLDLYCYKVDRLEERLGVDAKEQTVQREKLAYTTVKSQSLYVLDATCQEREQALTELVNSRFGHIEFRLNQLMAMIEKLSPPASSPGPA